MALIEKGIDFTLTEVDLYNKPEWFKQLSPYGKVPLLRHAGQIVYESRIINEYLEDAFPQRPLLPRDPIQKAKARIWIDYCDSYLMPALHKMIADRADAAIQIHGNRGLAQTQRRALLAGQRCVVGGFAVHAVHRALPLLRKAVGRGHP
jgi:glutathione S-transferase